MEKQKENSMMSSKQFKPDGYGFTAGMGRHPCLSVLLILGLFLGGCASYHPRPITRESVAKALAAPNEKALRVRASKFKHPILGPVPIDFSNGLSPDEAAVVAVLANPALRAARDEKALASAQLIKAGILPNPQLSASLEIPTSGATGGTINAYGLQIDWDLNALLTRNARVSGAKAHQGSVNLSVAWQEWQAAEAARLHWVRAFWFEKKVRLLEKSTGEFEKNLKVVRKAVKMGNKTAMDLAAAKTSYQKARVALAKARESYEQERLSLSRAMGLPPSRAIPLQDISIPEVWFKPDVKILLRNLERRRLDLAALKLGYKCQEEAVRAAILSQFPRIGIGIIHARDTGNVVTTGPALTLEIPLFNRHQGQIAVERATRKKLFDEYIARLYDARAKIVSLSKQIYATESRIREIQRTIKTQQDLLNVYREALKTGNAEILTYYQAKIELMALKQGLLDQWQTLTDLRIALEAASGLYTPLARGSSSEKVLKNKVKKLSISPSKNGVKNNEPLS